MSKAHSQTTQPQAAIRVIKTASCPSSSGRSRLTYQLGVDAAFSLHIKLHSNSGQGYFNAEWLAIQKILDRLSQCPGHFSSLPLKTLFEGRSINTPYFIAAVLLAEGFLIKDDKNSRYFRLGDVTGFMARAKALLDSEPMVMQPTTTQSRAKVKAKSKAAEDKPQSITPDDESLLETLLQPD